MTDQRSKKFVLQSSEKKFNFVNKHVFVFISGLKLRYSYNLTFKMLFEKKKTIFLRKL